MSPQPQSLLSGRGIVPYFAVLAALTAGVAAYVADQAPQRHAQPDVAGGYDVSRGTGCLGSKFDLRQSGQYVRIENVDLSLTARLRFKGERLTGDVDCVRGGRARLSATVRRGRLAGMLGSEPVIARQKRDPNPNALRPHVPGSLGGTYAISPHSTCLGGEITLGDGSHPTLHAGEAELGRLAYDPDKGHFAGIVTCRDAPGRVRLAGDAADRTLTLETSPVGASAAPETVTATKQRPVEELLAAFSIAVAIVILLARMFGTLFGKIGQPRVMGEVIAGILLGPTLLGKVAPDLESALFPVDVIPQIAVAANLGLIFYMFLVGLELDVAVLRGRVMQAVAISNSGVLIPMALGMLVAVPIFEEVGPDTRFWAFALFMGVSMSITAFPVLERILSSRRMLKRPVGAIALASAAIDDVTSWVLLAFATAIAAHGGGADAIRTIALGIAFVLAMAAITRRLLARASVAYEESGGIPSVWIAAIFAGILMSAWVTSVLGIAVIFGAFIMGTIMPRHAGLTEDVTRRVEDFVVFLLLPLFFAGTGLKTNLFLLDQGGLLVITLVLLAVAIICKFGGTMIAARLSGLRWRESAVIGTLMNTRGLTELIVLNLALEQGVISEALFAALVIMALVTTFMTGPLLRVLDPRNDYGTSLEDDLADARRMSAFDSPIPIPDKAILVAPQSEDALEQLRALAVPLARSEPPRELILAPVVRPTRGAEVRGGLQTESRQLADAANVVARLRLELMAQGIAARSIPFSSTDPGQDLVELADSEEVDLTLIDGHRPLLGGGVPRGDVGTVLAKAPSDVAVLVARDDHVIDLGATTPIVVPFGGTTHDWAALELGAWMASANGAPLKLLGAAGKTDEGKDAGRLLDSASVLVRQFAGVAAEPVLTERDEASIAAAAAGAGLLVIGLSERWRTEGLGELRSAIAKAAPAPILFVRRGLRPGALAPADDVTRFTWSSPALGRGGVPDLNA